MPCSCWNLKHILQIAIAAALTVVETLAAIPAPIPSTPLFLGSTGKSAVLCSSKVTGEREGRV
jgi:uncharacterized membrane protein